MARSPVEDEGRTIGRALERDRYNLAICVGRLGSRPRLAGRKVDLEQLLPQQEMIVDHGHARLSVIEDDDATGSQVCIEWK